MSMRNYAVYDYGLLLDEKTMKSFSPQGNRWIHG